VRQEPGGFGMPAAGQPGRYGPWASGQVRLAGELPARRDQLVSVALAPAGDRLAHSVGPRLSVSGLADGSRAEYRLPVACALSPGLTWSPDGAKLAFRDDSGQGRLVDLSGPLSAAGAHTRIPFLGMASALAFVPGGDRLVILAPSLPGRMTLRLIRQDRGAIWERALPRNRTSGSRLEGVNLAVSPDGGSVACTTGTPTVMVFDTATGQPVRQFDGHSQAVTGLAWIDDEWIVTAAADATLQVWCPDDAVPAVVVETVAAAGMTFVRERRTALIWSARGDLRAWSLAQAPAQLWYRDPPSRSLAAHFTSLAVSAVDGLLALVDAGSTELVLVSDWGRAVSAPAATKTYANAKVLMLGDSGVGKSGLAMVLAGQEFQPTESTHGRQIWRLPATEEADPSGDIRDVLIWDLAGQPGYRIVHQLHLEGAALALIVFDAKNETTPLGGVQHWARAVRHAHSATVGGLTTFLVAARADRGGINVSDQRIRTLMGNFGLSDYFKTSAKEGTNTDLLRARMLAAIDWTRLPEVTSTALFAAVKQFVADQTSSGTLLTPVDQLLRTFQAAVPSGLRLMSGQERRQESANGNPQEISSARLASVFEGCITRLESAGLVKRLRFGDYVLLQPELLDACAGAMVNAARDEPDGLGSILETKVVNLDFAVPSTDRVLAGQQEKLLVLATLEELLQRELVLREPTENGVQLVFPSAYRRDLPASEMPKGDGVVFRFEGPVQNVYATLIVRLTRSNLFNRVEAWQSAARFAADTGECTVFLSFDGEGKAELWIGFDRMPALLRTQFERFVHAHLDRRATPGTVTRERRYSCPRDGTALTSEQVKQVINLGRPDILCPVCEHRVSLRDDYELASGTDQSTAAMDASADVGREIAAASAVVRGKEEVQEFDVFLCHNWEDKPAVREIARQLRDRGLHPWLDERELRPGLPWQPAVEDVIASIPAAAVIVGSRVGPWQDQELAAFLRQFVRRHCAVVPVLLPGADPLDLPVFLDGLTYVNLAATEPDPIDQLVWGITGRQPGK
jgi:GTPase SAR1 family protein/nucleotide-binding universal stress UspA family protein